MSAMTAHEKSDKERPDNRSDDVVREEDPIRHACDACANRDDRAKHRYKAREDKRAPSVSLEESFCACESSRVHKPRVLFTKELRTELLTEPVAGTVACDCAKEYRHHERYKIEGACCSKNSAREEESISRKREHKTDRDSGLNKDNKEYTCVSHSPDHVREGHLEE